MPAGPKPLVDGKEVSYKPELVFWPSGTREYTTLGLQLSPSSTVLLSGGSERSSQGPESPSSRLPEPAFSDTSSFLGDVNRLGQSLVPKASSWFYALRIMNEPRLDAWALSTGSVCITTGLLAMLDNEAQLAYVLAREIGHVEHRHAYAETRGRLLEQCPVTELSETRMPVRGLRF